jgi:virulence factor Mce-like protein
VISKRIIVNLVVFFSLAVLLVGYGVTTLFGNPFEHPRTVVAELPDAAGLRPGFSASHDGVVVGTVGKVQLQKHRVKVTINLDKGMTVPVGVQAKVIRASAVGEQRLDLTSVPGGSQATLPDGAEVPLAPEPIPPDVADVLKTTTGLIDAIPPGDLNTVIHEAALGVDGRADDLRSTVSSLTTISDRVVAQDQDLRRLLQNGPPVLDDLTRMSPEVHQALDNTATLTRILSDRRNDLVALLGHGADLSTIGDKVVVANRSNLTCLMGDLVDVTGTLQGSTLANLDTALATNQQFFGLIDRVAVRGHAADVGYGGGARDDQLWLRAKLLVPPQTPSAVAYLPPRSPRPVHPGAACNAPTFGKGVAATPAPTTDLGAHRESGAGGTTSPAGGNPNLNTALGMLKASSNRPGDRLATVVPLVVLGLAAVAALAAGPVIRKRRSRT